MKKAVYCCALFSILVLGALDVRAQEENSNQTVYILIDFMKVPEGGDVLYQKVEKVWKKVHKVHQYEGIIKHWILVQTKRTSGPPSSYNYATIHVFDSWNKIDLMNYSKAWGLVQEMLTEEEMNIVNKTGESRELVNSELWVLSQSVLPVKWDRPIPNSQKYTLGFMKSKNPARHWDLETTFWKKIWTKAVEDGLQKDWRLWSCVFPGGSLRPYDMVAVHSHPDIEPEKEMNETWFNENFPTIFPDRGESEIKSMFEETFTVRDIPIDEEWTVVMSTSS